jgi:hypothetical protein
MLEVHKYVMLVQQDLDRMVNWTKTWQMIFNPLKCYVLKITKKKKTVDFDYNINGQTLETVASNPYLGAELTNAMSWDKQVVAFDEACCSALDHLNL